jgi:hypothetical protein
MEVYGTRRLRSPEAENARLKRLPAHGLGSLETTIDPNTYDRVVARIVFSGYRF